MILVGFKDRLDDVAGAVGDRVGDVDVPVGAVRERVGSAGERVGDAGTRAGSAGRLAGDVGLAVGQRVTAAGSSAAESAIRRGSALPAELRRIDPKEAADSAIWGLQAGSKAPGGPYSTALGTGLGAIYGAYSSVRTGAVSDAEKAGAAVRIDVEDEAAPTAPRAGDSMPASPEIDRRVSDVLPRNLDVERATAMAVSSYDWYKRGHERWGRKGGVAGAAFGVARRLAVEEPSGATEATEE